MQEKTQFGSVIQRDLTHFSIAGFESQLNSEWSYLASANRSHHSVHINRSKLQLISYCEGDVVLKTAPDMQTFIKEQMAEVEFAKHG